MSIVYLTKHETLNDARDEKKFRMGLYHFKTTNTS